MARHDVGSKRKYALNNFLDFSEIIKILKIVWMTSKSFTCYREIKVKISL